MLIPIFQKGELVYQKPDLKEIMAYADQQIQTLWPEYLRLVNPEEMWVQRSTKLSDLRDKVLKEELAADEPSVIISRRPCALLKYVKHKAPLKVAVDNCVGCKSCMRLGCPAISVKDKKAVIDTTLCVGCGVCQQMCKFDALQSGEE